MKLISKTIYGVEYMVDPITNNRWTKTYYTPIEIIRMCKSMINSTNCVDCERCYNCMDCTECKDCVSCGDCDHCTNCMDCESCFCCESCVSSRSLRSCYRCIACIWSANSKFLKHKTLASQIQNNRRKLMYNLYIFRLRVGISFWWRRRAWKLIQKKQEMERGS